MATTKSDVLTSFLQRKVREAIRQRAADLIRSNPGVAQMLMEQHVIIADSVAYDIARNAYGRMELEDILKWKIRRSHWD